MTTLTAETTLQRSPDLLASPVDDELVMMHIEAGLYYSLNAVATRIWELLETSQSIQNLYDQLSTEFDVEREACEKQVMTFLVDLLEKKVVQTVESEAVPA